MTADALTRGRKGTYVAAAWWTVVGASMSIGIIGLLTIGIFFIATAMVLGLIGLRVSSFRNGSVLMFISGLAAAPLLLAWLNRDGPGTVCRVQSTVTSCEQQWSPWPFAVVGVLLLVAGAALARRAGARAGYLEMPAAAPE